MFPTDEIFLENDPDRTSAEARLCRVVDWISKMSFDAGKLVLSHMLISYGEPDNEF